MTSQGGKLIVTFEKRYLEDLIKNKRSTITGDFYAQGDVNLSQVPDTDGKTTVESVNKTYHLNFGPDAVAQYGG